MAEYHARIEEEDRRIEVLGRALWDHADEFLLPIGPETGQVLCSLLEGMNAKRVMEIGTSYGYSTLWLAKAMQKTGGVVVSLDNVGAKQAFAQSQLARVGLEPYVEFVCGDALRTIPELDAGFDFVLLDILWKELYVSCFELLDGKLTDNAIVAADNMIWPSRSAGRLYRDHVAETGRFESILLPVGSGVDLSRLRNPASSASAAVHDRTAA